MKTMKLSSEEEGVFTLTSKDSAPCICNIRNLCFHEIDPLLMCDIEWINKGKHTNLQRKKMVMRTLSKILRETIAYVNQSKV